MEKIYDYFDKEEDFVKYSESDIKNIIELANKNGFLLLQDSFKSVPRKIMTSVGIIEVIFDLEKESDIRSEYSGNYMYYQNLFGYNYIGDKLYKILSDNLLVYLYSKPKVLLDYINTKHNLNLELKDIKLLENKMTPKDKTKTVERLFEKMKKNNRKIKDRTYIKTGEIIIEVSMNRILNTYA